MLGSAHERLVYGRRIEVLARHLAALLPERATVLDVGSGDGLLARRIMDARPDLSITGVDVLARPNAHIPVAIFDGVRLPFDAGSFDATMMVDVLHHVAEQDTLLRELARVARERVVIKDHFVSGVLAHPTLRFMDWVGNARHGVALPYAYWTPARWTRAFADAGLRVVEQRERLGLYPWPAAILFERRLHFIALLEPTGSASLIAR
jgi:SAM-dependent methyltransferase